MRCPDCAATNPDTARWCGQCLRRFEEAPKTAAVVRPASADSAGRPAPSEAASSEGFRRRGEALEWACPGCEAWNPISLDRCPVCGSALTDRFHTADDHSRQRVDERVALGLSAALPGAGHLASGLYGSGVARGLLFVVWLLGGVALAAAGGTGGLLGATPLLVGASLVWVGSLVDVLALSRGGRQLLEGRMLLWLVVAVTLLTLLGLFAAAGVTRPSASRL